MSSLLGVKNGGTSSPKSIQRLVKKKPSTGKEQSAKRAKRRNRKIQANLPTFYEMMVTLKIHLEEMMVVSAAVLRLQLQ
ncbi:hypothetical protein L6452_04994 [Arctium lappa]|uniref:Uncharacterized protein n=1 Tax=Arctium lappa TaxID=4217 RepID=A0ACB9EF72_ARCLA|nr:hypothetical protein L6452_04994 [Arctium lappa]